MSAVSGSPTQVKTSVTTAADLAGTPDDAFKEGDLGCVTALWPNATFRLRRTALGSTPDNVTSIAAFSGNGYWEVFPAGGNTLVFADIAALAAFNDVGLGDGAEVYVQTLRSYFVKQIEAVVPAGDAITVVPALSGDGAFYRVPMPQLWNDAVELYIDGVSGNDENDGLASLTPIATLAELTRRTYNPETPRTALTVFVTGDVSGTDLLVNSDIEFYGVPVETQPDADITAVTPLARAVYTPQLVTTAAASFDWAAALADVQLLRYTSNANAVVGYGWVSRANNANSAYTRTFDGGSWYDPVNTDTVAGLTIPQLRGSIRGVGLPYVGFYKCSLNGELRGLNIYIEMCSGVVDPKNCEFFIQESRFTTMDISGCKGVQANSLNSTTVLGLVRVSGSSVSVSDDSSFVGALASIRLLAGGVVNVSGSVEVYANTPSFSLDEPSAVLWLTLLSAGGDYIYGASNLNIVMHTTTNTQTVYVDKAAVTATVTGAQWSIVDGAGGTITNTFASLPATGATKLASALVGIFPSV